MSTYCNGGKKSSGTAKTALGLAIGGLSLVCVNSGLLGGDGAGNGGGGGLLGNLLGGGNKSSSCCCDPCPCYTKELARLGEAAMEEVNIVDKYVFPLYNRTCDLATEAAVNPLLTERNMVTNWILPLMNRTCDLEKEVAVNTARDAEYKCSQEKIQSLLFQLVEQNTNAKFSQTEANVQCLYNVLNNKIDSTNTLQRTITDSEFALGRAMTKYDISEATCNCIKGQPFLSPAQLADPYQAGSNIIVSRKSGCCCGNADTTGCWAGY